MKVMIAGIEVSVPLPPEAFCAWKRRASPTGLPGAEDGNGDKRGSSSRTQTAATATTDRPPVAFTNSESEATGGVAPSSARPGHDDRTRSSSSPRAFSSANEIEGIAKVGASVDDQQRPDADTTRPFELGEDGDDNADAGGALSVGDNISAAGSGPALASGNYGTSFAVGNDDDANTGGEHYQRRRSSCQSEALVTSAEPVTAAVEEVRQIEDGTRARRSSHRHVQLDSAPLDEALADGPSRLYDHRNRVGPTSGDSGDVAMPMDDDTVTNTPGTAATGAAGATGEAGGGGGGTSANTEGKGGNEVYFASSSEEENENKDEDAGDVAVENTFPPADEAEGRNPGDKTADGGVFDNSRRSFGTWGSRSRIEEDQAASAAASAFAGGVGWQRLRRDTVTALVRQLGRYL